MQGYTDNSALELSWRAVLGNRAWVLLLVLGLVSYRALEVSHLTLHWDGATVQIYGDVPCQDLGVSLKGFLERCSQHQGRVLHPHLFRL